MHQLLRFSLFCNLMLSQYQNLVMRLLQGGKACIYYQSIRQNLEFKSTLNCRDTQVGMICIDVQVRATQLLKF